MKKTMYAKRMKRRKAYISMRDIKLLLQWLDDVACGNEMIETKNYTRDYFGFKIISEKDLDLICDNINRLLKIINYKIRIYWWCGEIRPLMGEENINCIDKALEINWIDKTLEEK